MRKIKKFVSLIGLLSIFCLFTGCDTKKQIVSQVDEREANVILVYLASKGIAATKEQASSGGIGGGENSVVKFNIFVDDSQMIDAMSLLNQSGLPRKQGTNLLDLFAKQGLMSSDKEETIRYQAGLEQQITNTILLMDGVIDATVQLSFPSNDNTFETTTKERTTAAVYVKHQGIIDDPNFHLENKIKRLVSGSVVNLDINDVTVVSDRSRYTDIAAKDTSDMVNANKEYVSIWSIVMSKQSAARFRILFFFILFPAIIFAVIMGWLLWKFYPLIKRKGLKEFLSLTPLFEDKNTDNNNEQNE